MIGSRDAFLLGLRPALAVASARSHAAVDEAAATAPGDDELARSAATAHAAIDRSKETSESPRFFAECAAANHLSVPQFQPSTEWVARARAAVEPAIAASGTQTAFRIGTIAGDMCSLLYQLRAVAFLRATASTNPWIGQQLSVLLQAIDDETSRLSAVAFVGATKTLRQLEDRPGFLGAFSAETQHGEWIEKTLSELAELGLQFVNEPPVATAPPSEKERELYVAIMRNPASDQLREQYAAVARQRNDPRARLIELQLSARDLRRTGITPNYNDLLREAAQLIGANPEWTDEVVATGVSAVMHRGFVEEIGCDVTTFLARIGELISIAPILHVSLRGAAGRGAEIAACPALLQLQSLSFESNKIDDSDIAAIASSPYVEHLRWLDLGWNKITDAGVDALAAGRARSLVCVDLGSNPCADPLDEQVYYDETNYGWAPSERGQQLEAKHGRLAWLHPSVELWPPPMGIV